MTERGTTGAVPSGPPLGTRVVRAAAATLLAGTVAGLALLAGEAFVARNRRYAQPELGMALRSTVGRTGAPPLRLVLLGDSAALGVGVDRVEDTVGGQLARLLSEGAGPARVERQVWLSSVGVSGSRSTDLATQVARALLGERPDVAVILIGANDVVTLRRPGEAAAHLGTAVRRLRAARVRVVVGTCPDLGAVRAFAPPLRQLAGWFGRRIAQAQAVAVVEAGGTVVDLAAETGAVFRADAGTLCHDGYHPSADGYRLWAHALLPAVARAAAGTRQA
ncbi:SGNH/GDSL hydrolase family protein [Micromonospora sp. HM5-17]|jgi:lysophospholipase L1-like esterase|uniref:SGNH/GDSL hydrolase family protein n=1 Tax=Micromonospora sp. HM5-17 TaxID=2487710 RepID=UPI000F487E18|nr:SGNH/GDSL hydrolase family protein [Micromonospora sp. HM5-17]ROT31514.1 SGNH/GDSL hydrolase family protein [Micromonospora sp. HM5-17]